MTTSIKIGVSACLLGEKVRYDGGHKHDRYITDTLGAISPSSRSAPRSAAVCRHRASRCVWRATLPTPGW